MAWTQWYAPLQRALRRYFQSDLTYRYLRRALVTGQYYLRRADEPELKAFGIVDDKDRDGLVIDIGANGGQTAVAFGFICPHCRILSFEPNPGLWSELEFVRKLLGQRFDFKPLGVGNESGQFRLYVPYAGKLPVTTQASIEEDKVRRVAESLRSSLEIDVTVRAVDVDVIRFDDLGLRPDGIKIDVEGNELAALEGMRETITSHQPLVMFEKNARDAACRELLESFDYELYQFDPGLGRYEAGAVEGARNWFAVPQRLLPRFKQSFRVE
ncbi:MAG: FkbM family methyltransferase [Gammaproteobacteria bacterium]